MKVYLLNVFPREILNNKMLNCIAFLEGVRILEMYRLQPPESSPVIGLERCSLFCYHCQWKYFQGSVSRKLEDIYKYRTILGESRIHKHWGFNVRPELPIIRGHWKEGVATNIFPWLIEAWGPKKHAHWEHVCILDHGWGMNRRWWLWLRKGSEKK